MRENRLLFQHARKVDLIGAAPGDSVTPPTEAPAPAGAEPQPAGAEAQPAGVEPQPAGVEPQPAGVEPQLASAAQTAAQTVRDLEGLKGQMGEQLFVAEFLNFTRLEGMTFPRDGIAGVPIGSDFSVNFESQRGFLKSEISRVLADRDLAGLERYLPGSNDLKEVVAVLATESYVQSLNREFLRQFARFSEFVGQLKPVPDRLDYKLTVVRGGTVATVEFGPKTLTDAYAKFVEAKPAVASENEGVGADNARKANDLAASPIGKLLALVGYGKKDKDGLTGFDRIASGEDFLGVFLVGLFGYNNVVGDSYDGLVDMVPERYRGQLESWQKRARDSKFAYKPKEGGQETAAKEPDLPEYDRVKFAEVVNGRAALPEQGARLKEAFEIETGKACRVDLLGGEMTLPKGASMWVNGTEEAASDGDKAFQGQPVEIVGVIPSGVTFKGRLKFELV